MDREKQEPVEEANDEIDLYGISSWEERSLLDRLSVVIYWLVVHAGRAIVILLALVILVGIGGLSAITDPAIGMLTLLSIVPARLRRN